MPWGKIDDRAWRHVRFDGVSLGAYGLFWAAISYSNEKLLDGCLSPTHLLQLRGFRQGPDALVTELVEAGLWLMVPAGYQIHDYFDYNDSKAQILERRRENAEAQDRWRLRQRRNAVSNEVDKPITNPIANQHVPDPGTRYPDPGIPVPVRPEPVSPLPTTPRERPPAVRHNNGTRAVDRSAIAHTRDYTKMIAEKQAQERIPDGNP